MSASQGFKSKMMLYSLASSIAFQAFGGIAFASEIKLEYAKKSIDSKIAEKLWGDELPNVSKQGEYDPSILVASYNTINGKVVVTILDAMSHCGLNECPVRVFRDDKLVVDTNVCSNTDFHSRNTSGSLFIACDNIVDVPTSAGVTR